MHRGTIERHILGDNRLEKRCLEKYYKKDLLGYDPDSVMDKFHEYSTTASSRYLTHQGVRLKWQ